MLFSMWGVEVEWGKDIQETTYKDFKEIILYIFNFKGVKSGLSLKLLHIE